MEIATKPQPYAEQFPRQVASNPSCLVSQITVQVRPGTQVDGNGVNQAQPRGYHQTISTAGRDRLVRKSGVCQFTFVLASTFAPDLTKSWKNRFSSDLGPP